MGYADPALACLSYSLWFLTLFFFYCSTHETHLLTYCRLLLVLATWTRLKGQQPRKG